MTRRFSLRRGAGLLLAAGLLFVLAGDRGITASPQGIDPLEVLNLQIKPNVIIALDTSGSMEDTPYVSSSYGGDHPRSKIYQGKQVLKAVFQANQDKASFLFGVYRYSSAANPVANMVLRVNQTPNRFVYETQSWAAGTFPNPACTVDPTSCPTPNPTTVTLPVQGPSPSMATTNLYLNSLYAFQWIQNSGGIANNTLVFNENGGPTCTVNVTADFYTSGASLATAIQTAMNSCAGRANTYTVLYGVVSGAPVSVTSLTRGGGTATATTATPHGFVTGDSVTIAGASPGAYNGTKTITVTGANTFTYALTGTSTATGTITATKVQGTADRFSFGGTGTNFTLQWGNTATTLRGVLNLTNNQTVTGTGLSATANDPRINLLARTAGNKLTETYDPDGASTTLTPALDKPSPTRVVTTYNLDAQKYWNGETVFVDSGGASCDIVPGTPTNPPTVTLQLTTNCASGAASADPNNKATFTWGGGRVGTSAGSCQGFDAKVPLIPCNQTSPPQYDGIAPYLENQLALNTDGTLKSYSERNDGTGTVLTNPVAGGVIASSNTPLAQTTNDVRTLFGNLWNFGTQAPNPPLPDAIKNHLNPKEKTIFILVTDGDQNCSPFSLGMSIQSPWVGVTSGDDEAALGAAGASQKLYRPLAPSGITPQDPDGDGVNKDGTINGDPASSVTTYVVAFGADLSKRRADWIAWGGSGMVRPLSVFSGNDTWTTIPTQAERDACKTCVDSFLAPDPDTLKSVLETVINQGATSGEFSAQQSLTDSIFELSGDVPQGPAPRPWSPMNPGNRYDPLVPHRFVSTFSLPLFTGQIRAYTAGGPASLATTDADCAYTLNPDGTFASADACLRWSANDKLVSRVSSGMSAACTAVVAAGVTAGQCNFDKLWAGSDDLGIAASNAAIKRRIYTTSQNGVFGPTVDQLIARQSPYRIRLWPPQNDLSPAVAPASDTLQGLLDGVLGLPLDSAASPNSEFDTLRTTFKACMGSSLPATCPPMSQTTGFTLAQMQRARREAREMILAFLAGVQFTPDSNGYPKRATATAGGYTLGDILYVTRSQILAESTYATPALVAPPQEEDPADFGLEYTLYRDGPRDSSQPPVNPDSGAAIKSGFGLRNPDFDGNAQVQAVALGRKFYDDDTRLNLKPVMSVLYVGTNSALHAFRGGPSVVTQLTTACTPSSTVECGGEELWAFVPYDGLGVLKNRYLNNPQKRDPHDYMIARSIRFSDVFVPNPGTASDPNDTPETKGIASINYDIRGVWRKVIFFGRGIGGKYMTAIDVTGPGAFTGLSLNTTGPIVLWSRGNPDTTNGQVGGPVNHSTDDYNAYAKMGQTWSVPAVGYVPRTTPRADDPNPTPGRATATARKPSGVDFVLAMGSGYGSPGEGTTFYTLDALTGDVIATADVEQAVQGGYPELARSNMPYANALVANPVIFNQSRFIYKPGGVKSPNVAAAPATRAYIGDLYGRLWKFLTAAPSRAIPVADLGADQPVATAAALLGLPANDPAAKPYIYVSSGNDNRATSTFFHNFAFRDDGNETTYTVSGSVAGNGVKTYPPVVSLFTIDFPAGYKGTFQPATAYSDDVSDITGPAGRVFPGGTKFNAPNTPDAPPVPPYPCRSSFDSILYALGAKSGAAAYQLPYGNPYMIFKESRIVAVATQAAPEAAQLVKDEGLVKTGQPVIPPPPMGLAPTTSATQDVILYVAPGTPAAAVRFASTVCQ
jgi:hypothetical protein